MVEYPPSGYRPPRAPGRRRGGLLGAVLTVLATLAAWGKYALLLVGKVGALKTLLTLAISFGAYAIFFGPGFAAGLVVMILVHEMGHVLEIRRQGMKASAPLFIPFFGAAIFQRQHPQDALRQAQIGIAGPIAGTLGATVAFVLYGTTHQPQLLLWAYLGFFINLINLIPLGMLDGGWILAAVSKWFQVLGVALLLAAVFALGLSPVLLIIALLSIPAVIERFRNDRAPYYREVAPAARLAMGAAWLALAGYLGLALFQAHQMLALLTR